MPISIKSPPGCAAVFRSPLVIAIDMTMIGQGNVPRRRVAGLCGATRAAKTRGQPSRKAAGALDLA